MLFRLCSSMTSATAITGSPSVRSASNPIAMASERKSPAELARALLLTKSAAAPATSPITTCASTLASAPPSKSMVSRSAGPAACSRNSAAFPPTPFTLLRKALARPSSQAPEKTEPLSLPLAPPRLAWLRSACRPFAGPGQLPTFPHRSHDPARCVRIRAQQQVHRFVRGNLSQTTRQTHLACLMQLFHRLVKQVRIAPFAVRNPHRRGRQTDGSSRDSQLQMLGINRPSTGSRFVRFRRTRETMEPSDCDARRLENLWHFLIRLTQGARRHSHVVMHGNRDRQLGVWNIRATAGRPVLTLALAEKSL